MKWLKASWGTLANIALGAFNLACLFILLFPTMVQLDIWRGLSVYSKYHDDALHAAVSLGRLDAISILLTALGVILGLFAIVSFWYFKYGSEEVAREAAQKVANEVARQTAREIGEKAMQDTIDMVARAIGKADQGPDLSEIDVQDTASEDEAENDDDDGSRTNGGH